MSRTAFWMGQAGAIALAIILGLLEARRSRWPNAALEGARILGISACSLIPFFAAFQTDEIVWRVWIALSAPILTALLVNNAYVAIHRRLDSDT